MNKIGSTLLGVAVGALGTYFGVPKNDTASTDASSVEISALEEDKGQPMDTISIAKAMELDKNWTKFRKPAVDSCAQSQGQKQDDRSVAWNLKDLQRYLRYARRESRKLGYDMTGVRVHLGVYGAHEIPECRNLTTMFIVPTGNKITSKASTLTLPLQWGGGGTIPVPPFNNGNGGDDHYP